MSDAVRPTTLTVGFDPPIIFNGTPFASVTLREPTSAEYDEAAKQPGYGMVRSLMVSIGKLPAPVAALVPLSKAQEVQDFIVGFLHPVAPPAPAPEAPQEGDDAIFAAMTLREPTLAELDTAGVGRVGTARLIHFTTGVPLKVALRMPLSRAMACDAFFAGFATPARATGNS